MAQKLYYFGCISSGRKGHYLYASNSMITNSRDIEREFNDVNCSILNCLDGTFCQRKTQTEGLYTDTIVWPFRIVAWWDTTGDSRGNSNSALIGYGFETAEQIIDAAIIKFPNIMGRQQRPKPIVLPTIKT